jgi:D-aspartate ligase
MPVIVASPDAQEPGFFSRYCVARWPLPPLHETRPAVAALEALADRLQERFAVPVPLLVSNDDALRLVHAARGALAARFRMLLNEPAITAALLDKDLFAEFASGHGLPVPRCLSWEELAGEPGPVLVKPRVKQGADSAPGLDGLFDGNKAVIRESGPAARADRQIEPCRHALVFSEYVAGDDLELWCFDGVADGNGEVLACHTGRKLRCAPPLTGDSSYIELRENAALQSCARQIARTIGLKGIFNMDFKRDARGRFLLLEINARCCLWNYIGARNGLNLPRVYCDHLLGVKRPASAPWRSRYRWIDFQLDRAAFRALAASGMLDRASWIASLLKPKVYSLWSWSDPVPFLRVKLPRMHRAVRAGGEKAPSA